MKNNKGSSVLKILITLAVLMLVFGGCDLNDGEEVTVIVNDLDGFNAALARADRIVVRSNIELVNGAEYDFTGIEFISEGGVLIVPSGAEVTVIGSEGWGASAVSSYLRGEDATAWLHRPGSHENPDLTRRWWDEFAGNPHWCAPFAHQIGTISVKNEGQLRAALASTAASKDIVVLLNDIRLVNDAIYDFTSVTFVTEPGEYSIAGDKKFTSPGGKLIVPSGAEVAVTGTTEGWGQTGVARYLIGEDVTAWLHRPDFDQDSRDRDRRWWDEFAANANGPNPHWCRPFAHRFTAIGVKNEGQLRAALYETPDTREKVVLLGDIELEDGKKYDFTILEIVTAAGEYKYENPGYGFPTNLTLHSPGGILIIPSGATVEVAGDNLNAANLASFFSGVSESSKVTLGSTTYCWNGNTWEEDCECCD